MPKEKVPCKSLSIIMLDSLIKENKNRQTLLEESKYVQEKIKIENLIDDDLDKSESDSDSNDETESDIDNQEYDEWLVESILITIKAYMFCTSPA